MPATDFFGDDDPEDGYDATDSVYERLDNLILRLDWIRDHSTAVDIVARIVRLRVDLQTIRDNLR